MAVAQIATVPGMEKQTIPTNYTSVGEVTLAAWKVQAHPPPRPCGSLGVASSKRIASSGVRGPKRHAISLPLERHQ